MIDSVHLATVRANISATFTLLSLELGIVDLRTLIVKKKDSISVKSMNTRLLSLFPESDLWQSK